MSALGDREIAEVIPEDIDAALVKLAERGRLKGGKRITTSAQKPRAGSTVNRYLTQCGSVFKYAKRMKLVSRAFVPPTRGIERAPERADPDRYLRQDEVVELPGFGGQRMRITLEGNADIYANEGWLVELLRRMNS